MKLSLFSLLLWFGCGPDCLSSGGVPGDERCDATFKALDVVDKVLARSSLFEVSEVTRVIWIETITFSFDHQDEDGNEVYGRTQPGIVGKSPGCEIFVATREQGLISKTSLAHELLHCSFTFSLAELDGDPNHSRPEWKTLVPEANQALAVAGL